jgi:hypothetical protein
MLLPGGEMSKFITDSGWLRSKIELTQAISTGESSDATRTK